MRATEGKSRVVARIRKADVVTCDLGIDALDPHVEVVLQRLLNAVLQRQIFRYQIGGLRARGDHGDTKPAQEISQDSHEGWRLLHSSRFVKQTSFFHDTDFSFGVTTIFRSFDIARTPRSRFLQPAV